EHDDAIGVGPRVVAGPLDELPADCRHILLAAVQNDMHAAGLACFAGLRNEDVAVVAQAQRAGDMRSRVAVLVEMLEAAGERAGRWRQQDAIDMLKNNAGLIVAAAVDERTFVRRAGIEPRAGSIVDNKGVAGSARVLVE